MSQEYIRLLVQQQICVSTCTCTTTQNAFIDEPHNIANCKQWAYRVQNLNTVALWEKCSGLTTF